MSSRKSGDPRLRSGAMAMSRSALTHTETEILEEKIIHVGEGMVANIFEHLLARLEQHGLRRCLVDAADANEDDHDGAGTPSQDSGGEQGSECDARAPYYYMCVPCELRLSAVSVSAATLTMLQDAHHHLSSARHRHVASWMGDPDIDFTLRTSSHLDPTGYARIFVNGIPTLLSTRPGGGDMFFPLPHEMHRRERGISSRMDGVLNATHPYTEIWHHPLHSIFTGAKQILYNADTRQRLSTKRCRQKSCRHNHVIVQHVRKEVYEANSFVEGATTPALFEVSRQRLPKSCSGKNRGDGFRMSYVVADKPIMVWRDTVEPAESQIVVRHDGVYRVALLHENVASNLAPELSQSAPAERHVPGDEQTQVLSMDALRHVREAYAADRAHAGLNLLDANSSDVFARSADSSDVSS